MLSRAQSYQPTTKLLAFLEKEEKKRRFQDRAIYAGEMNMSQDDLGKLLLFLTDSGDIIYLLLKKKCKYNLCLEEKRDGF